MHSGSSCFSSELHWILARSRLQRRLGTTFKRTIRHALTSFSAVLSGLHPSTPPSLTYLERLGHLLPHHPGEPGVHEHTLGNINHGLLQLWLVLASIVQSIPY
jgi:hypothetical protein